MAKMAKMAKSNGSTGPQIQRRENWLKLPGEYTGFEVRVWLNCPARLWLKLNNPTGGPERLEAAREIVLEHNGWLDFDGRPYPPAGDPAFWHEIPTELAACILRLIAVEQQTLPNSIAPIKRR